MCVIIDRKPGIDFPLDKLKSACIVNPHGYGAVILPQEKREDGTVAIEVIKVCEKGKPNDPDEIASLLERHKNSRVILHLRYRTMGEVSLENCHPYDIFEVTPNDRNYQLYLLHNGTFSGVTLDGKRSDTFAWGQKYIRDFLEEPLKTSNDLSSIITNEGMLKRIGEAANGNRCLLVDNYGSIVTTNPDSWFKADGWRSSNEYSFKEDHRKIVSSGTITRLPALSGWSSRYWHGSSYSPIKKKDSEKKVIRDKSKETSAWKPLDERFTFVEWFGLKHISEVCSFSREDIETIVRDDPDCAVELMMDLIDNLHSQLNDDDGDDDNGGLQ